MPDGGGQARVNVEINSLLDFYHQVVGGIGPGGKPAEGILDDIGYGYEQIELMSDPIDTGLQQPGAGDLDRPVGGWSTAAGVFPEGLAMANRLMHRQHDFMRFLADAANGLVYIGSAAVVIGEIYHSADFANGASLEDVAFAFGDRGVPPPGGFRNDAQTYSDLAREDGGGSATPMALLGDDSRARVETYEEGGMTALYYFYPDGSRKIVVTTTRPSDDPRVSDVEVTETQLYDSDGNKIRTTTEESYVGTGGVPVRETTITDGDDQNNATTTVRTREHTDGSTTVTTTRSTTTDGVAGHPTQETVRTEPGQRRDEPVDTDRPLEEAVGRLGSSGNQQVVDGRGVGPQ